MSILSSSKAGRNFLPLNETNIRTKGYHFDAEGFKSKSFVNWDTSKKIFLIKEKGIWYAPINIWDANTVVQYASKESHDILGGPYYKIMLESIGRLCDVEKYWQVENMPLNDISDERKNKILIDAIRDANFLSYELYFK